MKKIKLEKTQFSDKKVHCSCFFASHINLKLATLFCIGDLTKYWCGNRQISGDFRTELSHRVHQVILAVFAMMYSCGNGLRTGKAMFWFMPRKGANAASLLSLATVQSGWVKFSADFNAVISAYAHILILYPLPQELSF